jgi:hypothetical protein
MKVILALFMLIHVNSIKKQFNKVMKWMPNYRNIEFSPTHINCHTGTIYYKRYESHSE